LIKSDRPRSTHAILSLASGAPRVPYRARAAFDRDVENALRSFYEKAVVIFGERHAACTLAYLLAKAPPTPQGVRGRTTGVDGSYKPRGWAVAVLHKYRKSIAEEFARG
jgi:hypothetical protein